MSLDDIKRAWAAEVRNRRLASGRSQATLAAELGSSQSRVAKIESGDPSVSCDLLLRALLLLGVQPGDVADVGEGEAPAAEPNAAIGANRKAPLQPRTRTPVEISEPPEVDESPAATRSGDTMARVRPARPQFRSVTLRGRRRKF